MDKQKIYERLEQTRRDLHERIDRQIDAFQAELQYGLPVIKPDFELPLSAMPACFKGRKPIAIVYPDGTEVYASNWRQLARQLLSGCAEDEIMHGRLQDICGKVFGRDRLLLSDSGEGMDAPINFCPGMYLEGKFDTESLLKVITGRIFDPIGYDYRGIRLRVYDPALRIAAAEQLEEPKADSAEDENEGFGMQML